MPKDHIETIARGLIRWGNSILACRDAEKGYLYLPGGHVEFGEGAEDAVLRELREEAGIDARVLGCAMVCECRFEQGGRHRHELNLVFHVEHPPTPPAHLADAAPPEVHSREPRIAFEWVELASIVDRDFRPRAIKAWLVSTAGGSGTTGAPWLSDAE